MWWVEPLLVYGRHYAAKYKKPLCYAAGALVLFGSGYAAGWTGHSERVAQADASRAEAAVQTIVKEVVKRDEVERLVYVQDLATVRKLEAERDRLRAENVTLQERVDFYVPQNAGPDGSGYLSVGAVRLLDRAAADPSARASSPATPSVEEATTPSDVSWRDLTRHTVLISGRYNDAMLQCNALIDWVELNIVKKPAP